MEYRFAAAEGATELNDLFAVCKSWDGASTIAGLTQSEFAAVGLVPGAEPGASQLRGRSLDKHTYSAFVGGDAAWPVFLAAAAAAAGSSSSGQQEQQQQRAAAAAGTAAAALRQGS